MKLSTCEEHIFRILDEFWFSESDLDLDGYDDLDEIRKRNLCTYLLSVYDEWNVNKVKLHLLKRKLLLVNEE